MADFLGDTGSLPPESLIPPECTLFGLVMNSERVVQRIGRRRLAEYTLIASRYAVPDEIFRAAAHSEDQARYEADGYNLSVEETHRAGGDAGS